MNIEEKIKKYNFEKIVDEKIDNLIGIAALIVYDGVVSDLEFKFLQEWLWANDEFLVEYPLDKIKIMMKNITADGVVTKGERTELLNLLEAIACNPQGDPVNSDIFDLKPTIQFSSYRYVITGELLIGSREKAIDKIHEYGGIYQEEVTKETDYVVVGALGSPSWKHGKFGNKIKGAIYYQRNDIPIQIIRESDFKRAIIEIERG